MTIDWEAAARKVFGAIGFPDEDPKCLECKLLPCCHGGCHGWRWMRDGVAVCSEYRADPDSYVLGELTRLKAEQARKQ